MKWRSEPNNWIRNKIRFALTYQERDIYMCLKDWCGQNDTAYIERSEGIPYSLDDLSSIIGEPADAIQKTLDKLVSFNVIEYRNGTIHLLGWAELQYIKPNSKGGYKNETPAQKELREQLQLERLTQKYPQSIDKQVTERIVELFNKGVVAYVPIKEGDKC